METTQMNIPQASAFDGTGGNVRNGRDLQIYAMEAQCPHLGADLSHAEIEDYEDDLVAVCPWHRYDFNLKTGKSDTGLRACVYAVEVRQDDPDKSLTTLWIEPPTSEEAWEMVDVRPVSEGELRLCTPTFGLVRLRIAAFAETSARQHIPTISQVITDTDSESENIEVPLVPDPAPNTLLEWSNLILNTPNAALKVERTRHAVELFCTGRLKSIGRHKGAPVPPDTPPREPGMTVVDPSKVARRGKGGSLKSRVTILHALANIEQWA
jgi:nitrite reductase/ring-hydroxylating ferredoxin subunit